VSVIEPSDAVKRRNGYEGQGTSTRVSHKSPPPVNTFAWLG